MQAAARLGDPIAHSSAESGLISGALIGGGLVIAGALIVGTGGAALPFVIGAELAGVAVGGWIGEFVGSLSFFNKISGQIASGSPDVFVNYKPLARAVIDVGECSKHGPEPQQIALGSETVFINYFHAARVNDKLQCSGIIVSGSPDVFIGGGQKRCTDKELDDEVAWYYRALVFGAGVAGAFLLGGWAAVPGIVGGFAVGWVGGEVMGVIGRHYGDWLSENIGGMSEDWEKSGRFIGQAIGGWLGAKGGPKAWEAVRRIEVKSDSFGANGGNIRIKPEGGQTLSENKPSAPVTREAIVDKLGEVVQKWLPEIKKIDPNARVGFRGGLARGFKGKHKGNAPFDPNDFDVDAFVISDELYGKERYWFKVGPESLREIGTSIDEELRQYPEFKGMRTGNGKFKFRIFSEEEITRKAENGDAQFHFIEAK